MKTTILLIVAMLATNAIMTAQADGFMDADTERARNNEANNACEIHGALGADKQACFSAYLCVNYGDCDGQNMQPIAPTPGGGVYRDDIGGANNG
jgi:hypothetical protein